MKMLLRSSGLCFLALQVGAPMGQGIAADNFVVQSDSPENLEYHRLSGSSVLGHLRLAIVGGTCGQAAF